MKFLQPPLLFIVLPFLFASCISTKRYAGFTKEKLTLISQTSNSILPEYLEIKTDSLNVQESLVKVEKLKSFFIPAILYWQSEHTLKCELSPEAAAAFFKQDIIRLADSLDLKTKLNGKKLELSILQVPHSFVYTHKETAIIFIVAYIVNGLEAIYPDNNGLKISYRISENGETRKTGILTAPNTDQPIKNIWKSSKKFTWFYLDQYRSNCTATSRHLIKKLLQVSH